MASDQSSTAPATGARSGRRAIEQLVATEARQYAAILDWLRRRDDVPESHEALRYDALAAPLIWMFLAVSLVELVVVHVLLEPWPLARWIAFVLGLWGVVWLLGFLAAYRSRPHHLAGGSLLVRAGAAVCVEVPLARVGDVRVVERDLGSSSRLTDVSPEDGPGSSAGPDVVWLGVGVSGRTNVQLRFDEPLSIEDPRLGRRGSLRVASLGLWADDPRRAARTLDPRRRERLDRGGSTGGPQPG